MRCGCIVAPTAGRSVFARFATMHYTEKNRYSPSAASPVVQRSQTNCNKQPGRKKKF